MKQLFPYLITAGIIALFSLFHARWVLPIRRTCDRFALAYGRAYRLAWEGESTPSARAALDGEMAQAVTDCFQVIGNSGHDREHYYLFLDGLYAHFRAYCDFCDCPERTAAYCREARSLLPELSHRLTPAGRAALQALLTPCAPNASSVLRGGTT